MGRILIVEDETHMRRILASNLRHAGHEVAEAAGTREAKRVLAVDDFEVAFVDQRMPDGEGLEVLAFARDADPALSVVMLTAVATIELAVEAMRRGAFDVLTKPFEPEAVLAVAARACERTLLLRENSQLKREVNRLAGSGELVANSSQMRAVLERISRVAPTNATVLITGETGTGKELVARCIHKSSPRASKPLVAVNCAAFTETLLESELFGHEKGAFTGADRRRPGLFEAAHEGTLFLDEVGEMSLTAQAKLLRVLTDGQVMRVGSTVPHKVDVRVLVATHRDLVTQVARGLFRNDLYYRLAVVPIHIPPLRERPDDIAALCEFLSLQAARDLDASPRRVSPEALRNLRSYEFPGNVRELKNLIERACILSAGETLGPENFPVPAVPGKSASGVPVPCVDCAQIQELPENFNLPEFLEHVEKSLINHTLESGGRRQAEAARKLGLSRSVLSYKLSKYSLRTVSD